MTIHPLILRARMRGTRSAKGMREAAAALTGETLADEFETERANAPDRSAAGKKYLLAPNRRLHEERNPKRDSDHAAIALVNRQKTAEQGLLLPDDIGRFEALHAGLVLKAAAAQKKLGDADPNFGIEKLDVAGVGPDARLCFGMLRFLPQSAPRLSAGDTPLRALLEALAQTAVAQAHRDPITGELSARTTQVISNEAPMLMLIGSQRYWELQRKREAQRGAAWIREFERLAGELEANTGVKLLYLALRVNGDPGWNYKSGAPEFDGEVRLLPAWEHGAGRVRPRKRGRRPKRPADSEPETVEPDFRRPVRDYSPADSYAPGDRMNHKAFGVGVVQGVSGVQKIRVMFGAGQEDEHIRALVHERGGAGRASAAAPASAAAASDAAV